MSKKDFLVKHYGRFGENSFQERQPIVEPLVELSGDTFATDNHHSD